MTISLRLSLTSIRKVTKRAFCSACITIAEKGLFSRKLTRRVCLIQHEGSVYSLVAMYASSVVYFFNCCSIHKLYYGHFCFSPYAVNAIFNFSCVCVVSNRFLLVPLSQWCRLAVRKYIHIIFFHWYLIYMKVNIYIIAIFLCDIQFVDKKIDIFWYIFL